MKVRTKKNYRERRHARLRKKISGTADRPRMSVNVSNRHMIVQFIDDVAEKTLAAASTNDKQLSSLKGKKGTEIAEELGRVAAEAAKKQGIEQVVFDRGGFAYGSRLKALADAARKAGLVF